MTYWFLGGLLVLVLGIALAQLFVRANPAVLALRVRRLAGILLAALAALCFVTGRMVLAAPLAAGAAVLLGWRGGGFAPTGGGSANPTPGQTSAVDTVWLAMTLDHGSGGLDGTVKQGRFAGKHLGELSREQIIALLEECRADQQSASLIETYLDRVHADWRDAAGRGQQPPPPSGGGRMSRDEALQILGLKPDATAAQIKEAHHRLMLKVHPDQGGSDYLAAKLNEAKDVLLG